MSGIEKVMVFGAGISGKGAAMELADQGKTVFLYDDMPKDLEPELTEMLARNGGGFVSGNIEEILQQMQQIIYRRQSHIIFPFCRKQGKTVSR